MQIAFRFVILGCLSLNVYWGLRMYGLVTGEFPVWGCGICFVANLFYVAVAWSRLI